MTALWVVLIGIAALVLCYFAIPALYLAWLRRKLEKTTADQNKLALTFDDGPSDDLTNEILDRLRSAAVPATFFTLGRKLAESAPVIARIREEGHELACHGHAHPNHWRVAPWTAIQDIRRCWHAVEAATGLDARKLPFRPPHGKLNLASLIYLWWHRTPIAMWTLNSGDTWEVPQRQRRYPDGFGACIRADTTGVVLLHDFDRKVAENRSWVLAATAETLSRAPDPGRYCAMSELLSR